MPTNTPADATLYIAGSFNNWNPGSAAHALTKNADGSYQITLPAATGNVEYKFTRGSWASVETNASNQAIQNRRYTFGNGRVVEQRVQNWQDLAGGAPAKPHTAAPNVAVLADSFSIPQLYRKRRVWVYLPPNYATSNRRYPVLYMHDGQNVFDNFTAFSGEWGVDEALNQLQAQGQDPGCIVVAVDHGGDKRLNEYSPWRNPQYGGGQGNAYVDFLAQTLKPHIDAKYRTLPGRQYTGVAGSSMGGLISLYAALKYPHVFGKAGIFSPAFWFAPWPLFQYIRQHRATAPVKFYFAVGGQEGPSVTTMAQAVRDSLQRAGFAAADMEFKAVPDGQHTEAFWRREFPAAYQWLYPAPVRPAGAAPGGTSAANGTPRADAAAGTVVRGRGRLHVLLPGGWRSARAEILDTASRSLVRIRLRGNSNNWINVGYLPAGNYTVRLTNGKQVTTQAFVKE